MAETDPVRTEAVESQAGKLGHALQSLRWGPKGKAAQGSSAWPVSSLGSPIAVETRTASVLGQIFKISYSGRFSRLILVTPCFYPSHAPWTHYHQHSSKRWSGQAASPANGISLSSAWCPRADRAHLALQSALHFVGVVISCRTCPKCPFQGLLLRDSDSAGDWSPRIHKIIFSLKINCLFIHMV